MVQWRRRFHGNPVLWRRLFKGEKVVKELTETAPVIAAVMDLVGSARVERPEEQFTVVDLCAGKGFLSMFLSEMLDPDKVERFVLVDKAWPRCGSPLEALPHQMNWEHIYGNHTTAAATTASVGKEVELGEEGGERGGERGEREGGEREGEGESTATNYFTSWPIQLVTSKQDLKKGGTMRRMREKIFDRAKGPVLLLAVHLCGTLSLKAVEMFNAQESKVKFLALKP